MKTIFIVNPKAGKGKKTEELINSIKNSAAQLKSDIEIYITKSVGDAEDYVRNYCLRENNSQLRFIACGGDGTFNEVINGAIGNDNAAVGVLPMGTGNDFCRNFKNSGNFSSVKSQLQGIPVKCDAIRYINHLKGNHQIRYCANMFNIGFDCNVADMTASIKKIPFIRGALAYMLSVFIILIKKKGADLKIELDDKMCHCGQILLTSVSNGSYCGGGIKSNPNASINDGFMDVNIIHNISRLSFLQKLPYYMKGTHTKLPNIEKVIENKKCKRAVISPCNGSMRLCTDGEITDASVVEFEIIHNAFNFLIPSK